MCEANQMWMAMLTHRYIRISESPEVHLTPKTKKNPFIEFAVDVKNKSFCKQIW